MEIIATIIGFILTLTFIFGIHRIARAIEKTQYTLNEIREILEEMEIDE